MSARFTHAALVQFLIVLLTGFTFAQSLDPSFSPILQDFGSSGRGFPTARSTAIQLDGKILVAGKFAVANGKARSKIARFNADYTLDISFDAAVLATDEYSETFSVQVVKLQADGKILIGGNFKFENDETVRAIARLNADGSLDSSFQSLIMNGGIGDLEIQADGKIVIGGTFQTTVGGVTYRNLARLNPDGSFDPTFVASAPEYSNSIVIQQDGKIVAGNDQFSHPFGIVLRRYNTNGSLDATLATIEGFGIDAVELQADGKIVIAGDINYVNGVFRNRIAKINPDGSLDPFNLTFMLNGSIFDIALEADGKVMIVGDFWIFDNVVTQWNAVRANADGTRDTSFNIDRRIAGIPVEVNFLPDGQYLFGGQFPVQTDLVNFNTYYENIARVSRTGVMQAAGISFSVTEQGGVFDTRQQPDGKILVGGEFQFAEGASRRYLARYNLDGSFDAGFNTQRDLGIVQSFDLQSDGKIVAAHGGASVVLSRVFPNGALDTSFNTPFVPFSSSIQARTVIQRVYVLPDNKILVGGKLITGSSTSPNLSGLVRLNPDGTRDSSFQLVAAVGGIKNVTDFAVQADGKIVIVGDFTVLNGGGPPRFARVNTDGTVDTGFVPPIPPDTINEVELQPDGKIVYAGTFGAILRTNPNGAADPAFNVAHNNTVETLTVDPTGRIYAGGTFTTMGGLERRRLARITAAGNVDAAFNAAANNAVYDISLQSDGRILIGGQFTKINGQSRICAARLAASSARAPFDFDGDGKSDMSVFRPSDGNWYALRSSEGFIAARWGLSTDRLVPADYDGDGKTDLAVFRRGENSTWYILNSATHTIRASQWGATSLEQPLLFDTPVPADYDGDGKADLAVWRTTDNISEPARFVILQSTNSSPRSQQWGSSGDRPVPADFDGDGKTDLAIYRSGTWWILRSIDGGHSATQFGLGEDKTVTGDYDGDGRSDLAVFRPSNGVWFILGSSSGFAAGPFGIATDIPTPADFDGDGKTDFAVYRDGTWHIMGSLVGYGAHQFGLGGDQPIPGAFVR